MKVSRPGRLRPEDAALVDLESSSLLREYQEDHSATIRGLADKYGVSAGVIQRRLARGRRLLRGLAN